MTDMKTERRLDSLDAGVLLALIDEPDITSVALAQRFSVSRNTIHTRLQRLSETVLASFQRRIVPSALGYEITAFMSVSIQQGHDAETIEALSNVPEVIEAYATTGDADLLLTIVAHSPDDLYRVNQLILSIPGIVRTSTSVMLRKLLAYRTTPLLERFLDDDHPGV